METAFLGIMWAGMFFNTFTPSVNAQSKSDNLKLQIKQAQNLNNTAKAQYAQIAGDITKLTVDLQSEITDTVNKYIQLQAKVAVAHNEFLDSYKKLQEAGIVIIIVMFLLLLLKQFELLGELSNLTFLPFTALWGLISGSKVGVNPPITPS